MSPEALYSALDRLTHSDASVLVLWHLLQTCFLRDGETVSRKVQLHVPFFSDQTGSILRC
jgi:hypothetical protein